jgi:hypothetical protein
VALIAGAILLSRCNPALMTAQPSAMV